jgi:hypothetical protein
MSIEQPPSDSSRLAQLSNRREATAANPVALAALPRQPVKSGEIGCVLAGVAVRIGDRSAEDYSAFLDEL